MLQKVLFMIKVYYFYHPHTIINAVRENVPIEIR